MADFKYSAGIDVNLNIKGASNQLKDLQKQLQQISNMKVDIGTGNLTADIEKASEAAMKLSAHLATATNPQTGNLDFTKFYTSIQKSGASLEEYGKALQNMGPAGQKAFVSLADSISKAEIPLKRTSKLVDGMWDNLKKTIGWQMSSSMVHGFIGSMQQAMGYAKDLNKSLTDIRIVTGASSDQMAQFAKEANKAAKSLSTTTTDYTKASLIYYQQGLSDQEVKARTETTIKMANATGTSAQKVSDQMTAIWNNFDNGTKSLTHYADVMTALGAATASSTDEIAQGLQKFAAISDTVGLSYEYAATALATITATSRESADIVGNSLKTLFTRIQGLQLGETLDDGTTLNKYSTALAKVGISIKDSSGELKDMDLILDEMGNKWETLARDEQMALAQTVAGVRQYTQLMTLMENWDQFKQNLNIANTSSGTLDAQAAIYAESWEAASQRVRASWEGLWDNLISSDGFITILDGLSGFIDILDKMVTGMGGAGGALLSFGGIMTKVFNKQIASGISDIAYGIKMLFPSQQQKAIDARNNLIKEAQDSIGKDQWNTYGKDAEYAARREGMSRSLENSLLYSYNKDKLSVEQQALEKLYAQSTEESLNRMISASKDYDNAKEFRADFHGQFYDENMANNLLAKNNEIINAEKLSNLDKIIASRSETISKAKGKTKDRLQYEIKQLNKQRKEILSQSESEGILNSQIYNRNTVFGTQEDYLNNLNKQNHQDIISKLQEQRKIKSQYDNKDFKSAAEKDSQLYKDQQRYNQLSKEINTLRQQNNNVKNKLSQPTNFSEALMAQGEATAKFNQALTTMDTTDAETFMKSLNEFTHTASNSMGSNEFMKNAINMAEEFRKTGDRAAFAESFTAIQGDISTFMRQSMDSVTGAIYDTFSGDADFIGKNLTKEEFMKQAADAYRGTAEKDIKMRGAIESYTKQMDDRNANLTKPGADQTASERLVSGASGAMEALAAGEAIKSFTTSLQDGSATLTSSLTSITSAILQGASGFQGLATALTGLGGLSAGAAGGIALVATALLALASTAVEFYDQMNTSNKEMMQNFTNSDNELASAASTAAEAAETAKIQNDEYLEGVEKIKSLSHDPTQLAEDVYESNKRALELISQYGLQQGIDGYTYGANGLIEIDKKVLDNQVESKKTNAQVADYAQLIGQAVNAIGRAEMNVTNSEKVFSDMVSYARQGSSWMPTEEELLEARRGGDEAWAALQEKYNWDNLNPIQTAWKKTIGTTYGLTEADWDKWYDETGKVISAGSDNDFADIQLDQASQVVANKILADNGITAATQEGFTGYQAVIADSIKQQFQDATDIIDTTNNQIINEDAIKQILESQGQKSAHGFRMDSGVVYYTLDGESQERSYTGETLNAMNAANQIDSKKAIDAANSAWEKAIEDFGKDAAEAGLNIEQLGTVSGASADSVQALFTQGEEAFKEAYGNNKTVAEEEYNKVDEIFGDDGIVKALGLDPATLSEVSMGTLETLQNQTEAMGAEGATYIGELFSGLKEATGAETAEDLAKIVTALSSMDFSDSAYSNLLDLKSTLEAFGFNVDTSGLEALYAILAKLAGLTPGGGLEDLADTNKKITANRGALNQIASDQAVDEATRNAGIAAGLNANDFTKDENGNYIYNGSQEDIKYVKGVADRAFASNQFLTNQAQHFYKDAFGDSAGQTYENFQDLYDAAVALEPGVADFINSLGLDLSATDSDTQNQILEAYNQAIENGQTSEETQQVNIQDYMAQITSANDMMNAVRNNLFSGNGFINEDGIISDEVMARLDSFPATSERVAESFNALKAARENYQEAINDEDPNNDMEADNLYNQAVANYDLATAIDAVAEARGLDAEQVAFYTEQLQNSMDADELSRYSPDALADLGADLAEQKNAIDALNKAWGDLSSTLSKDELTEDKGKALKQLGKYLDQLTNSTLTAGKSFSDLDKGYKKFLADGGNMQKVLKGDRKEITKLARAMEGLEDQTLDSTSANKKYGKTYGDIYKAIDEAGEQIDSSLEEGLITPESFMGDAATQQKNYDALKSMLYNMTVDNMQRTGQSWEAAAAETAAATGYALVDGVNSSLDAGLSGGQVGIDATPVEGNASNPPTNNGEPSTVYGVDYSCEDCGHGYYDHIPTEVSTTISGSQTTAPAMDAVEVHKLGDAPSGSPAGGGGGGGGAKEPKKVANKFKSQYVKRYKRIDHKIGNAVRSTKSAERKQEYLYGESKIAQLEKINKLTEKEAKLTADRIEESRKYLIEDRQNLVKYLQKYGYEAEFDADGFLSSYEKVWTDVYEQIAALYEDNLLTEEESKIEEDLNVMLEELEQALEDYENSLDELANDIEEWEEALYSMFDNEIEQMEHKVEFKLELDEDSLSYIDYLIENLGDSAVRAIDKIELIADKTDYLFNSIETAYQGIQDIYALSDSPLHLFATGGVDIDGLLTESQVEALRGQADSLIDFANQLREIRDTIQEQVAEAFDMWTEKVNHNLATLEHYGSIMEYFKNIIDLTGNDIFGLSTDFVRKMESTQINQSIDQLEANKAYYEELQSMRANVEAELQKAQASNDAERIAYWEEHLRTVTEEMQSAQDSMLSALENTLTMISDQFTAAMEDAVEAFNESIYISGGLEGLSNDYSLLREEADLMAEDYDKIYNLSKIARNINKTLDDSKIIAGKQRLNGLLSEINELQASGVEMSKYDLEYLEAKYQLYLAQIELENAQNAKDTVRLSKDSEGNWSYVYTQNMDSVEEAEQKYEDALYEMQNKNHEYLDEMSSSVIDLTSQMNEEIAALEISDFANLEEYNAKVEEIQQKYLAQIGRRESELDKAITNNQELYEKDWRAYSAITDYKISADENWINSFRETTLGYLTESESVFSDFGTRITEYAATLAQALSGSAGSYFSQIETTLKAYDSSIATFGASITKTYKSIQDSSDLTASKTTAMAEEMKKAFEEVVTKVGTWQETDGLEITEMLDKIATYLEEIFAAINKSANIKTDSGGDIIGQQEAVNLLSNGFEYNGEKYSFGNWKFNKRGDLDINDSSGFNKKGSNLVDYHAYLATQVQDVLDAYYSNPNDEMLKAAAEALIKKYWAYRSIIDRVYDPGEIEEPNVPTGLATGGYTGEWGDEGKLAILHEKELVLSASDTANFLEALNISKDVIHSMIEMNARASSLALGDLFPSLVQDFGQTLEQQVSIVAEFPDVTDRDEIAEALNNLINTASQYANRK